MANFCPFFFYKFDFVGTFFSSQWTNWSLNS
jgi:hypothetical protein